MLDILIIWKKVIGDKSLLVSPRERSLQKWVSVKFWVNRKFVIVLVRISSWVDLA